MYYVTVFGDPGGAAWGWRVGGHHLAVNYTLAGGQVAASPLFLDAHPAVASLVGPGVLRPLAGEEDLARDLLATLDRDQLAAAVLAPAPPPDIVQANRAAVDPGALPRPTWELFAMRLPDPAVATMRARDQALRAWMGLRDAHLAAVRYQPTPAGLPGAGMSPAQRALLLGLVRQYLDRLPAALAAPRLDRLGGTGLDEVHFAWAGEAARGAPHYYRVHGPRLLVEYANAQDGADHVHSVWRDPAGDFGADLLGHAQP
jgi:hypothetical protein